jgi:hypothetical protein
MNPLELFNAGLRTPEGHYTVYICALSVVFLPMIWHWLRQNFCFTISRRYGLRIYLGHRIEMVGTGRHGYEYGCTQCGIRSSV